MIGFPVLALALLHALASLPYNVLADAAVEEETLINREEYTSHTVPFMPTNTDSGDIQLSSEGGSDGNCPGVDASDHKITAQRQQHDGNINAPMETSETIQTMEDDEILSRIEESASTQDSMRNDDNAQAEEKETMQKAGGVDNLVELDMVRSPPTTAEREPQIADSRLLPHSQADDDDAIQEDYHATLINDKLNTISAPAFEPERAPTARNNDHDVPIVTEKIAQDVAHAEPVKHDESETPGEVDHPLDYDEDFDDRTLLDVFAVAAKEWMTHKAVSLMHTVGCFLLIPERSH